MQYCDAMTAWLFGEKRYRIHALYSCNGPRVAEFSINRHYPADNALDNGCGLLVPPGCRLLYHTRLRAGEMLGLNRQLVKRRDKDEIGGELLRLVRPRQRERERERGEDNPILRRR